MVQRKRERKPEKKQPVLQFNFNPESLLVNGPIIEANIGITPEYGRALQKEGKKVPEEIPCRFLIDTGADSCLVRHELALQAGLQLISAEAPIHGVGVDITGRSYLGLVWFEVPIQRVIETFHRISIKTEIVGATLPYEHIDGLFGRDILQYFDLRYNGKTGKVTLKHLRESK